MAASQELRAPVAAKDHRSPVPIRTEALRVRVGGNEILKGITLDARRGEILSIIGPAGAGKTTFLRCLNRMNDLDPDIQVSGNVFLDGVSVYDEMDVAVLRRQAGMVFSIPVPLPMSILENLVFGLRLIEGGKSRYAERVEKALRSAYLWDEVKDRMDEPARNLSGGQQQRLCLARTLALEPQILLLDEPLSNLDASLREETRRQLRHLIDSLGITAIFVTHDQEEAFALSDRIALLSKGVCQQVGTPQELYYRPVNEFVAKFIGNSNLFSLPFKTDGEDCLVFSLPGGNDLRIRRNQPWQFRKGEVCRLLLRPERIEFEKTSANIKLITAKIMSQQFSGAFSEYELEGEGLRLTALQTSRPDAQAYSAGESLDIYYSPDAIYVFQCGS